MPMELTRWDADMFLDSEEVIAAYHAAILEDSNPKMIAIALGHIAKAKGMSAIAAMPA